MKLDVATLVFILGLVCFAQLVAVSVQYRMNRGYHGIGWWLAGTAMMVVSFVLLPLGALNLLQYLGLVAHPLLILAHVFLYIGVVRFLGQKEDKRIIYPVLLVSVALYYYFMFIQENMARRAVVVSAAVACLMLVTGYNLILRKNKRLAISAHFTAGIFLANGCFLAFYAFKALSMPPVHRYQDLGPLFPAVYIVPIVASTLWTFGFILMANQRLNLENQMEKEVLQKAEAAIRESEAIHRSILDASPDDITITDLEGRVLIVSPAAYRLFGYRPGEEKGKHLLDFLVPEDRPRAQGHLQRMFQEGRKGPNEYRGLCRDESVIDIEVTSGVIFGREGQPAKLVFMVRDITGRKQTEAKNAELEARNRQLEKAESLGRMAGAIAHHFNNRLQAVMNNLELLGGLARGADPGGHLAQARLATEGAADMSRLMLAYLGQTDGEQEPRDLADLCRSGLSLMQGTLPASVAIDLDLPSPGPVIRANANQVQQILASLVTNAWEAMGEAGGRIRIGLGTVSAAEIPAGRRFPVDWQPQAADYACLTVADEGCGIKDSDLEKLFDPFFTTKFAGRGLGLPVLLGLVQAHGGAVTVAPGPGRGSVFRVHFPLCADAPEDAAPQAPAAKTGGTILLVDDDESLLMSTGAMLELLGFEVLTASDGLEAVAQFRQRQSGIRCVITDLTMPRMDGWETLAALRRLDAAVPVILTSGYDPSQAMAGSHPEQPQAFLGKPFGFKQLRAAVEQVVR
ncbi:MAG: PAS domain S-box protein [Holophaga sp.]|nr:PAS domain S-box protein [Holophaga sp.]